jgi:hypothetical protein
MTNHNNMQHVGSMTKTLMDRKTIKKQVEGVSHKMLPNGKEGFKTKVISPEDVIPLEKDNKF